MAFLPSNHRFMLKHLLEHLRQLEEQIEQFTARIEEQISTLVECRDGGTAGCDPG